MLCTIILLCVVNSQWRLSDWWKVIASSLLERCALKVSVTTTTTTTAAATSGKEEVWGMKMEQKEMEEGM